ncbi:MAG: dTDP-4-dehydrorhamnose reductase [Candidatus Korobacteraceae bacterium]
MRILLTGVHGQVGTDLLPLLRPLGEVVAASRAECDLASLESIRTLVADVRPDVIVNPAAYTAVNDAEAHRELACAINATAPGVLAEEARKAGAMLVHYSTDYVFDGAKPGAYTEDDVPAPLNVYGASKLAGERAVAAAGGRFLVLRTSWVYGANGNNFLKTILRLAAEREELKIVDDQVGAPTSSMQLAQATARLVRQLSAKIEPEFPSGLYHATADGSVSWCGFAQAIVAAMQAAAGEPLRVRRILPIRSEEYPTPARRPLNSVLSNQKFERTFGFRLESWQQGLAEAVREIRLREANRSAGKNAM